MDTRNDMLRLLKNRRPGFSLDPGVSPLPPPDEVFADWLLSVPHGADIATAARRQVELIDDRGLTHPDVACLRMLLVAIAG